MSDETLIEDVEINLEESHVVGLEVGEVHDSEEPADGFRTTIIVDEGSQHPRTPA
jgi:hypothetical protein